MTLDNILIILILGTFMVLLSWSHCHS